MTFVFNIIYLVISLHNLILNNDCVKPSTHKIPEILTAGFCELVQILFPHYWENRVHLNDG